MNLLDLIAAMSQPLSDPNRVEHRVRSRRPSRGFANKLHRESTSHVQRRPVPDFTPRELFSRLSCVFVATVLLVANRLRLSGVSENSLLYGQGVRSLQTVLART